MTKKEFEEKYEIFLEVLDELAIELCDHCDREIASATEEREQGVIVKEIDEKDKHLFIIEDYGYFQAMSCVYCGTQFEVGCEKEEEFRNSKCPERANKE